MPAFSRFSAYGPSHIIALALIGLALITAVCLIKPAPDSLRARSTIRTLIVLNLLAYPLSVIAHILTAAPESVENFFPFHLCHIAAFLAALSLWKRHPLVCELTYYFGLSGTVQGLATPALTPDFPDAGYISFFFLHGIVVISALILPVALGWRPRLPLRKTVHRTFLAMNAYALFALLINSIFGSNYGYLREKPPSGSILDLFGPWPIYLIGIELLAYALFWILTLPFLNQATKR